jgi:uncharacterized protein (TIGR03382 family)
MKWLVLAAIAWPALLTGAWADRARAPHAWSDYVYAMASRICHQRPDRSFHTDGVQWPVCGRCSGLYASAPFGALAGAWLVGRRRVTRRAALTALAVAAVPTALTVLLEWPGVAPVTSVARALAALPLGALTAFVVVHGVAGWREPIG